MPSELMPIIPVSTPTTLNDALQLKAFTDAVSDVVARTIAGIQREAKMAEELRQAEYRAFFAEQRETVSGLIRKVEERLSEVKDGKDGERGEKGDEGAPGKDGDQGPPGRDGSNGADGRDGADADMEALQNELIELVAAFPIPENGKDGKDAYPGEARGLFDPTAEYRAMDVVSFNGSEWRAKRDNPGELPGDGWMLSASKGKRGDRGERGPVGVGKDGKDGATPVELKFDADKMQFIMALDDGNILEADFYPVAKAIRGDQ